MQHKIRILKALADETRLNIVLFLMKNESSVLDIVKEIGKSQPNISIALRKLDDSGIIKSRKEGNKVFYSVAKKEMMEKIMGAL